MEECGRDETITEYLRRASQFKAELKKDEYDVTLLFLNDVLELSGKYKMKSVTEFKRIGYNDITKDIEKNKKIMEKYSNKLSEIFFMELVQNKLDDKNYIIDIMKAMVDYIGYKLIKKKYNNGEYYFIKL